MKIKQTFVYVHHYEHVTYWQFHNMFHYQPTRMIMTANDPLPVFEGRAPSSESPALPADGRVCTTGAGVGATALSSSSKRASTERDVNSLVVVISLFNHIISHSLDQILSFQSASCQH